MNITRGKKETALKVVLYGPEGIGKSTFASQFPGVVFIDTEGSTSHMDVARTDSPRSWAELMEQVRWFQANKDSLGTLAIDTLDWAEKLAMVEVCRKKHVESIEDIAYGKGYVFMKDLFRELLEELDKLKENGIHIILTAHAQIKKFEQPDELGSYDRFSLKLNEKNIAPLVKEWADLLLFANFKTDVVKTGDGKSKGRGGEKRVMYTQHSACWDAKNRFELGNPLPFEFGAIAELFPSMAGPVAEIHEEPKPAPEPVRVAPAAVVTEGSSVPAVAAVLSAPAKKTKKQEQKPRPERPDSMRSDNEEKDAALQRLWNKMMDSGVEEPLILMAVVAEKDYYDITVPVKDYETDFIQDVLIEAWDQVNSLCQTKMHDLPF